MWVEKTGAGTLAALSVLLHDAVMMVIAHNVMATVRICLMTAEFSQVNKKIIALSS